ncbi:MAG: bifunctional 23S rRNA (guanine(2069)-N(7))-methyltransferase RlmK/23S rRNA (guanine(2445)-N(2))-methyltransferase RlmL [Coriobacteriia bacterium]
MGARTHPFFATAPKGLEHVLAEELSALGADDVREARAGASFAGTLDIAYRACLWSRVASRVLLPLVTFPAPTPEAVYEGVRELSWEDHLHVDGTLAVDATSLRSALTHTRYAAQVVKDAVVDRFRDSCGTRPSVDLARPDVRISLHLQDDMATVSIDLAGEALHRRGYREPGVQIGAPLKETLAAGILVRAGWPEVAARGGALVDPVCGSGTLLIEGAWMAGDVAPGLLRDRWGFSGWLGHDVAAWEAIVDEARERREAGSRSIPVVAGSDADARAVDIARACVRRAGLEGVVAVAVGDAAALEPPEGALPGLVVANPPYGERLGDERDAEALYATLGERFKRHFPGWRAAVLLGDPTLGGRFGMRPERTGTLYNGALRCTLLTFEIHMAEAEARSGSPSPALSDGAEMFANRIRKNVKRLGKWARKEGVTCWRVYDADMPEYALAIDRYETVAPEGGEETEVWLLVAEYEAPATIDPVSAARRLDEALSALPGVLDVPRERVVLKRRRRQRGASQYEVRGVHTVREVSEGGLRFLVDMTGYLDVGLFLDHRPVRALVRDMARGKRFLNLFAYTGAASVCAAAGGAVSTLSVDLSKTYLERARRNLARNGFGEPGHRTLAADCVTWLETASRDAAAAGGRFGLILLDPPTFSNSKRMPGGSLDIQRDHAGLVIAAASLLENDGVLVFSTNGRRFRLDTDALASAGLSLEDVSAAMLPPDFARDPKAHACFLIRRPVL